MKILPGMRKIRSGKKKEFNLAHFGLFTFKLENGENPLIKRVINFNELLNQEKNSKDFRFLCSK